MLGALGANLVAERYQSGSTLITAGTTGDELYILREGEVEVLDGGGRRLATLGPGDYFGEIALIRDVPRTATVRAWTPVTVDSLSKQHFLSILESYPQLGEAVLRTAAERESAQRRMQAGTHAP
jgi:ATP-binding cassette subfamily B protein